MIRYCKFCGKEFVVRRKNHFYCCRDCKHKDYVRRRRKENERKDEEFCKQLCWKCANCYGRCSWSDLSFTPIKGWKATHSVKVDSSGNTYDAYTVIECPEFEPDRRFYE